MPEMRVSLPHPPECQCSVSIFVVARINATAAARLRRRQHSRCLGARERASQPSSGLHELLRGDGEEVASVCLLHAREGEVIIKRDYLGRLRAGSCGVWGWINGGSWLDTGLLLGSLSLPFIPLVFAGVRDSGSYEVRRMMQFFGFCNWRSELA